MRRMLYYTCFVVIMALMAGYVGKPAVATNSGSPSDGDKNVNKSVTQTASTSTVFGLTDDVVVLPIQMSNEFPMIEAKINGVAGRFMFDTGSDTALSLNDKAVPLPGGKVIGNGFFGSGQKFEIKRYPTVSSIELGSSLVYHDVRDVIGQSLEAAEGFGGTFLGFIGYHFYDGYLFKLDYSAKRVTFYKQTEARQASKDFLKDETIIAVIPFETRKLPNHPIVALKIGEESFLGCFDTGQLGQIIMDKATRAKLMKKHFLIQRGKGSNTMFELRNLTFTPTLTASVSGVPVSDEFLPAEPLGITEKNIISFGYAFLQQYKTVWDFSERKLYLLKA